MCHSRKVYFCLFLTSKAGALTVFPFFSSSSSSSSSSFFFFCGGGVTCFLHSHGIYLGTVSGPFPGYVIYRKKSVNQRKKLDMRCLDSRFHFHTRDDSSLVTGSGLEFNSMHFLKNGSN